MNTNSVTQAVYSTKNQDIMDGHKKANGLKSNEWAGFHQWRKADRKVKKGAKGCAILMVCDKKKESKEGKESKFKVCKRVYVFNFDHTEAA